MQQIHFPALRARKFFQSRATGATAVVAVFAAAMLVTLGPGVPVTIAR